MAAEQTARTLSVEVAYALPERQTIISLRVAAGTTLAQALAQARTDTAFANIAIDPATVKAGIFGKLKPLDTVLRDGDRVEIYRPLRVDPKQQRRLRAAAKPDRV